MCVNERQDNGTVRIQEVAKVDDLKYLGSTVQSNGECGRECTQDGMEKNVRSDRIPARVKGNV